MTFNEEKYRKAVNVWLEENRGKTINNIKTRDVVSVNNEIVHIGARIKNIKSILSGNKNHGKLTSDQYEFWVNQKGLTITSKKIEKRQKQESKYRKACEIWLKENDGKTVNDIPNETLIRVDGEVINIGRRVKTMKCIINGTSAALLTESEREYWINQKGLKPKRLLIETEKIIEPTTDKIEELCEILREKYGISSDEYKVLLDKLKKYQNIKREYEKYDVGLEPNMKKKKDKMIKYNFDKYDIEESFFMPFELKNRNRLDLLRQLIIDWNYYSSLEKKELIKEFKITPQELKKINALRDKIDETIYSVEEKMKKKVK